MYMKIIINNTWGAFDVSKEAQEYCDINISETLFNNDLRTNERLIEFIERFGSEKASGEFSLLQIREIPDNVYYEIINYDGMEYILYSESPITTIF